MDPDACLEDALRIANAIVNADELDSDALTDATNLAELVIALNDWLSDGGFRPKCWNV